MLNYSGKWKATWIVGKRARNIVGITGILLKKERKMYTCILFSTCPECILFVENIKSELTRKQTQLEEFC